jgi:hypothetical protein
MRLEVSGYPYAYQQLVIDTVGDHLVADGRTLDYYDGMHGRAEARVRAESILVTLFPALKALRE